MLHPLWIATSGSCYFSETKSRLLWPVLSSSTDFATNLWAIQGRFSNQILKNFSMNFLTFSHTAGGNVVKQCSLFGKLWQFLKKLNIVLPCARVLSRFSRVWLFVTLWTVAWEAPLSMGFSRQEYWSGLPFPPPGDLPGPGIETTSLMYPALAGRFFTTSTTWPSNYPPGP